MLISKIGAIILSGPAILHYQQLYDIFIPNLYKLCQLTCNNLLLIKNKSTFIKTLWSKLKQVCVCVCVCVCDVDMQAIFHADYVKCSC